MSSFVFGAAQSEADRIDGGVRIIVNAIADTFGLERSDEPNVGILSALTAEQQALAAQQIITAAPNTGVIDRPDTVQQAMGSTDP